MTEETTSEQLAEIEGQGDTIQVREGRWRTRRGDIKNIRPCEPLKGAYYVWPWTDGFMTFQDNGRHQGSKESPNDLVAYLGPIEQQPQPQPEPEPVQVREGRWRTRGGQEIPVTAMPTDHDDFSAAYPWWDGNVTTWANNGRFSVHENAMDLDEYLGPIEEEPQPEPEPEPDAELQIRLLKQANDSQAETIGRLLSEAHDLNMEIGGLQRRLSERDARIRDLETIYSAATKSFEDANKANDALRVQVRILQREADKKASRIEFLETLNAGNGAAIDDYTAKVEKLQGLVDTARGQLETAATEHDSLSTQLAAVKAELASVAADRYRLQIELDAAQQVPVDSPELRQLRADLADVTLDRDQYKDAYTRLTAFVETVRETAKAEAVEAIVEWLQAFRGCNSPALALLLLEALPSIMRTITGLAGEEIE